MCGVAPGQVVNKASNIVLGSGAQRRQQQLKQITSMTVLNLPFSYLGVPIFRGKPSKRHLQESFNAVKSKMEGWKGATLSMAGRLQLVKSVIHNKLLYSFPIYLWHVALLKQLDYAIRNFIWTDRCDKKKLVLLVWLICVGHWKREVLVYVV